MSTSTTTTTGNDVEMNLHDLAGVPFWTPRRGGHWITLTRLELARIEDNITVLGNGCWRWNGKPNQNGYGQVRIGGRDGDTYLTHHVLSDLVNGHPAQGRVRGHRCHDEAPSCDGGTTCPHRLCCNPAHLRTDQTIEENAQAGRPQSRATWRATTDTKPRTVAGRNLAERKTRAQRREQWETERKETAQKLGISEQQAEDLLMTLPYSDIPTWSHLIDLVEAIEEANAKPMGLPGLPTPPLRVTVSRERLSTTVDPSQITGHDYRRTS